MTSETASQILVCKSPESQDWAILETSWSPDSPEGLALRILQQSTGVYVEWMADGQVFRVMQNSYC